MPTESISLSGLAYVCRIYDSMTGFIESYSRFQAAVDHSLDLGIDEHRHALLAWLNDWGCRNLAEKCHERAAAEVGSCWALVGRLLPQPGSRLLDLDEPSLDSVAAVFDQFSGLPASVGHKNGHDFPISFGPTPTSKTLFALRSHLCVAWDAKIRDQLGYDKSGVSYVRYLRRVRNDLRHVGAECSRLGLDCQALPETVDRRDATLPQLVGEHYWMTITRRVEPPSAQTLAEWLAWS